MGCNGMSRQRTSSGSSVMFRKLRRLRVTVIFYTCGSLCAILLLVNFNEDVKRLLQQSHYSNGPHEQLSPSLQQQQSVVLPPQLSQSQTQQSQQQLIESSLVSSRDVLMNYVGGSGGTGPTGFGGSGTSGSGTSSGSTGKSGTEEDTNPVRRELNVVASGSVNGVTQHEPPSESQKPWFMWRGTKFPQPLPVVIPQFQQFISSSANSQFQQQQQILLASIPTASDAKLWHEDNPNSDRIVDQLMYAIDDPINYPNGSFFPAPPAHAQESQAALSASIAASSSGSAPSNTAPAGISSLTIISGIHNNNVNTNFNWNSNGNNIMSMGGSGPSSSSGGGNTKVQPYLRRSGGWRSVGASGGSSGSSSSGNSPPSSISNTNNNNQQLATTTTTTTVKTILLYYGLGMSWGSHITNGRHVFLQQKCPVNACRLTGNRAHLNKADAVVFKDVFMNPKVKRLQNQLWIMYMLECPLNTQNFIDKNVFNMTATYRHDSDIVTPYEKWVYYDDRVKTLPQSVNYGVGKTKKVAWFVSNCVAKNNRLEYARELGKYIEVDIYGACGTHSCSRANAKQCFDLLSKHYKFYLAFENSNCRDYISEKFFVNGLGNKVLPIVMGAHPDDYKRVAPEKSYIHVDDFASPKELAAYLHQLDSNDELYNEYFKWKGTGEFVNTHFFCRLCAMVHYAERSDHKPRYYDDFNKWWRGSNVCTRRSWRNQPDIFAADYYDKQITYHNNHNNNYHQIQNNV